MRCPWAGAFLEKILGDHEHTCSTTPRDLALGTKPCLKQRDTGRLTTVASLKGVASPRHVCGCVCVYVCMCMSTHAHEESSSSLQP